MATEELPQNLYAHYAYIGVLDGRLCLRLRLPVGVPRPQRHRVPPGPAPLRRRRRRRGRVRVARPVRGGVSQGRAVPGVQVRHRIICKVWP